VKQLVQKGAGWLVTGLLCAAAVQSLGAATIFDNSTSDLLTRFSPGTLEVGDQVILAGTERYLTQFRFEYWGENAANPTGTTFDGEVQARIRFYLNNGPTFNGYSTPGDEAFFDSGFFSLNAAGLGPTERGTIYFLAGVDFAEGGLLIPTAGVPGDEFTWTVQFQGMTANDTVGLDLYSPPSIGGEYTDYWQNSGSGWILSTNIVPMDFAALMEANQVPEPSAIAFWVSGGLALLVFGRRIRRSR
jgi:hypothetical protein